jgi:hypothetical protein
MLMFPSGCVAPSLHARLHAMGHGNQRARNVRRASQAAVPRSWVGGRREAWERMPMRAQLLQRGAM